MKRILFCIAFVAALGSANAQTNNLANPELHPYADPAGGLDVYRLSTETVNEARLYDFYQRQADFYRSNFPEMSAGPSWLSVAR